MGFGVRVRNADSAHGFAPQFVRGLILGPLWIVQVHIFVRVAMGPAVDRNRFYVSLGVESIGSKHGIELLFDLVFKGFEGCRIQGVSSLTINVSKALAALCSRCWHMIHK